MPIVVAGAQARGPAGPLVLAAGLALTFGVVGGVLASLGFAIDMPVVRGVSALVMVVVGAVMLIPLLDARAEQVLAPLSALAESLSDRLPAAGLLGQFAAGIVLAFAWAPCIGPTIGAAFALAASGRSLPLAMATMSTFAVGAAASLLAVGYGIGRLAAHSRTLVRRVARLGQAALGCAFVLVGALVLTGVDRALEGRFVEAMPDWLVTFATRY